MKSQLPCSDSAYRSRLEIAKVRVGASETTLWLFQPPNALRAQFNAGKFPGQIEGLEVPLPGSIIGWVWAGGQALCCGSAASYNRKVDEATGTLTKAMAAVPVPGRDGNQGVLSAINPLRGAHFTGEDLVNLQKEAAILASMLEPDAMGDPRDDGPGGPA